MIRSRLSTDWGKQAFMPWKEAVKEHGTAHGPMLASPDNFTITVQGKCGHEAAVELLGRRCGCDSKPIMGGEDFQLTGRRPQVPFSILALAM
jgi:hypothetical protein